MNIREVARRAKVGIGAVSFDDRDGAAQATEYLLLLGHKDVWFVGDTSWLWNLRQYEAYKEVKRKRGLEPRATVQDLAQAWHELGKRAARRILESREPCTAVFAASDYIAAGVIEAPFEAGREVPRNLSVIGFDDLDEFSCFPPRITSVGTTKKKIGEYCTLQLIRQIEGGVEQSNLRLPIKLVEGGELRSARQSVRIRPGMISPPAARGGHPGRPV